MTPADDPRDRYFQPQQGNDWERRVSSLEGWRGTVEEWRSGVDSWRRNIEREGLVTAVAVIGTKMDQQQSDIKAIRTDVRTLTTKVESLEDERTMRRGVGWTGKTVAAILGALAAAAAIIGTLVVILASATT